MAKGFSDLISGIVGLWLVLEEGILSNIFVWKIFKLGEISGGTTFGDVGEGLAEVHGTFGERGGEQ